MFGLNLTALGTWSVGLLLLVGSIGFLIRRYTKAKKREGAAEVIQAQTEGVLDEVKKAKRVEEAARRGTDPEWDQRVRDASLRD